MRLFMAVVGLVLLAGSTYAMPPGPSPISVTVTDIANNKTVHAPIGTLLAVNLAPVGANFMWQFHSVVSPEGALHWDSKDLFFVQRPGTSQISYVLVRLDTGKSVGLFIVTVVSP